MNRATTAISGIALVAGGAIGAGMFSLPIVAAGMWFSWAAAGLAAIWLLNLWVALILLESNLKFSAGSSFSTMVAHSLGRPWQFANNLAIAFVMYILLYAYFSAAGSIANNILQNVFAVDLAGSSATSTDSYQRLLGLGFGFLIMLIVWSGASWVARICLILLVAMAISFAVSTSGLLLQTSFSDLLAPSSFDYSHMPYLWAALPYFVTAFACSGLVPSLVKYYGSDTHNIRASLLWGTLISLFVYLLWLAACFGSISRAEMAPIIAAGGNMGDLANALQTASDNDYLSFALGLFSNFAITTSFLSIGLGLFDYIADGLKFDNTAQGRLKTALITFAPPAIFSLFYPKGFILAIGYAGLVVVFSFYVIPVLMAFKLRLSTPTNGYRFFGGRGMLVSILGVSLALMALKLATSFGQLITYP